MEHKYVKYITYSSNTKENASPVKLAQMHIGSSCTDTAYCTCHCYSLLFKLTSVVLSPSSSICYPYYITPLQ